MNAIPLITKNGMSPHSLYADKYQAKKRHAKPLKPAKPSHQARAQAGSPSILQRVPPQGTSAQVAQGGGGASGGGGGLSLVRVALVYSYFC